jgi:hypothetical protein
MGEKPGFYESFAISNEKSTNKPRFISQRATVIVIDV